MSEVVAVGNSRRNHSLDHFLDPMSNRNEFPEKHVIDFGEAPYPLGYASGTQATLRNGGSFVHEAPWSEEGVPDLPVIRLPGDPEPIAVLSKNQAGTRFRDVHPVGVQFLLGDGSVRCLGLWIDQRVYRSLLNRRDGGVGGEW